MLERIFSLSENKTTARREILAGLATFFTMSYIIFVQPAVLTHDFAGNPTGLDFGAVLLATCLASAFGSILMGLYAKYPIALAPGMGENFFFITVIMALSKAGFPEAWRTALGIVFISGVLFVILSIYGAREAIVQSLSPSMRSGIAVGIGLFIALIGLRNGGILIERPSTGFGLNPHLFSNETVIFFLGLAVMVVCHIRKLPAAILIGIFAGTLFALLTGQIKWTGAVFGLPQIHTGMILKFDLRSAFSLTCLPFIIVFLFMNLFDNTGSLIAVAEHGGFMKNNELPRVKQAFFTDALATMVGSCLGTSTVTSYIESAAGVSAGGRTGLTSVTTGLVFLLAIFFSPLIALIGQHPSITAPALLIVGCMMTQSIEKFEWRDPTESIPGFLIMLGIPLSYSIADGIALGFLSYPLLKLASGKAREIKWPLYFIFVLLLAYFAWIRPKI